MNDHGDDGGLSELIAGLDQLRRSRTRKGTGGPGAPAWPPLGGGAPAPEFTATLLGTLVGEPTASPALRQWVDELAPAHEGGDRPAIAARSLLEAFPEPDELLTTIVDTLLAAGETETLAALLRHVADAAGLHAPHRKTLTALLDARLLPLCELVVATPHGSLPSALATALVVAPSYAQAIKAMSSGLDTAGPELLELTVVVNSCAVTAWERLAAGIPETVMFRAALAAELARYATNLAAADRHGEAVSAARRAVAVDREMAADDPGEYLPDLVEALAVLVGVLLRRNQAAEAREAVGDIAGSVKETLAGFEGFTSVEMCNALSRLATLAHDNNWGPEACRIGLLGLDCQLRLEDPGPEEREAFCQCTVVLADWLHAEGAAADAVSVLERAAAVAKQLTSVDPAYAVTETDVLHALAAVLTEAGRTTEAADVTRRAQHTPGTGDSEGRT
ncbi:hypothetical protein RKD49_007801 [Streptomyces glaucescens]